VLTHCVEVSACRVILLGASWKVPLRDQQEVADTLGMAKRFAVSCSRCRRAYVTQRHGCPSRSCWRLEQSPVSCRVSAMLPVRRNGVPCTFVTRLRSWYGRQSTVVQRSFGPLRRRPVFCPVPKTKTIKTATTSTPQNMHPGKLAPPTPTPTPTCSSPIPGSAVSFVAVLLSEGSER